MNRLLKKIKNNPIVRRCYSEICRKVIDEHKKPNGKEKKHNPPSKEEPLRFDDMSYYDPSCFNIFISKE
jgi:hypothetical protein